MKFCTSYFQPDFIRNQVQEVRFSIMALMPALEYAGRHPDKKVIIEILSLADSKMPSVNKLYDLQQENNNVYYDFYALYDLVSYSRAHDHAPRHIMLHQPVDTWGLIQILMYYHVSDITIDEPLTFDLPNVLKDIKSHDINIRIRPNIAKNRYEKEMETDNGLHHFWVLPQHLNFYEDYIDVIDLIDNNSEREAALVKTYLSGNYEASLSLLVEGIEKDIGAPFITDKFVTRRLSCGQVCMKSKDYCHHCDQYAKMYEVIAAQRKSSN